MSDKQIFIKVYVNDAVKSGLIADMGSERWATLTALASYMNSNGICYPTVESIAHALGVSTSTASRRIQRLAKYRFKGEPVIEIRNIREEGGQFGRNFYKILPSSGVRIF